MAGGSTDQWLERTLAIFSSIDITTTPLPSRVLTPSSMTLRERKTVSNDPASPKVSSQVPRGKNKIVDSPSAAADVASSASVSGLEDTKTDKVEKVELRDVEPVLPKKLPRVLLRVKDPEETPTGNRPS